MTIEQFRQHMADGLPVENGSEAHMLMHQMSRHCCGWCGCDKGCRTKNCCRGCSCKIHQERIVKII